MDSGIMPLLPPEVFLLPDLAEIATPDWEGWSK